MGIDAFADHCLSNIESAEREIASMSNDIEKAGEVLRRRLDEANIVLSNANMKLNLCEAQPPRYDENGEAHYPSCSSEKHDVRVAQEQVKAAQNALSHYNQLLRELRQYEMEYQTHKSRFINMVDNVLRGGSSEMQRQQKLMEEYIGGPVRGSLPAGVTTIDIHKILRPFVPTIVDLVAAIGKIDDMWQDSEAEIFKSEVAERWRNDTYNYLNALQKLAEAYEAAQKIAQDLINGKGDFNSGWINIYQAEMLIKRKISRWFTGRDDFRP
jgi:cell division ATPase FtsA